MRATSQTVSQANSWKSPWAGTLVVSAALALLVGLSGVWLARQETKVSEPPAGNRVDDAFRQMARRVDGLESLWEKALDEEAARLLDDGFQLPKDGTEVVGVAQRSLLNAGFSDPARAHLRDDGSPVRWRPVFEKFARKEPDEWVFSETQLLGGSGWIEMPDKPLAWWRGNGRSAVVLILDPRAASGVVSQLLQSGIVAKDFADERGAMFWSGPDGKAWLSAGKAEASAKPDEILRHVSRFGDWTLRRYYPVKTVVTWRVPVLVGSFSLAALLLAGGVAVALWQRKAIRIAEDRVSFVNRVSHELRTPLTNLLLNTDLAIDGLAVGDDKARRRLGLIREETSRLSRIVDNVLAFARIERGRMETRKEDCEVDAALEELRETFAPLFERKSIICEYENRVSGRVAIDRDAFSQILSNLLSNIEKYAGESAKARVIIDGGEAELTVEVSDSGPGIPIGARQRVFLPFERAGSRVNEGASGTGLGLAISRELAGRMGGRLDLLPSETGARFRLIVPLRERSTP